MYTKNLRFRYWEGASQDYKGTIYLNEEMELQSVNQSFQRLFNVYHLTSNDLTHCQCFSEEDLTDEDNYRI